jgi:hypothetical protein
MTTLRPICLLATGMGLALATACASPWPAAGLAETNPEGWGLVLGADATAPAATAEATRATQALGVRAQVYRCGNWFRTVAVVATKQQAAIEATDKGAGARAVTSWVRCVHIHPLCSAGAGGTGGTGGPVPAGGCHCQPRPLAPRRLRMRRWVRRMRVRSGTMQRRRRRGSRQLRWLRLQRRRRRVQQDAPRAGRALAVR